MLTNALHRLVAWPRVYDAVQCLAGAREVQRRLEKQVSRLPVASRVIDLGGGTGISRGLWPADCLYICLDLDPQKLRGFLSKHPGGMAVLADGTQIPIATGSVDVILCKAVSHHLSDPLWLAMLDESARVLAPQGTFVFVDAIWAPTRLVGRLLWRFDRGAHPRSPQALRAFIARRYEVRYWERFATYHEFVLCTAVKAGSGRRA
jgi:SAM-dependent methyltransferase